MSGWSRVFGRIRPRFPKRNVAWDISIDYVILFLYISLFCYCVRVIRSIAQLGGECRARTPYQELV